MRRIEPRAPPVLPTWYAGPESALRPTAAATIVSARGMDVTFADGRSFEDWSGSMFVNNIGLGRPEVAKELADQAALLAWADPDLLTEVRLALASDLRSILPRSLTTLHYGVGGSDCMEAAVRAARKVTGRKKVLVLTYAYHGDTLATESLSDGMTPYGDPRPWVVRVPSAYEFWEAKDDWDAAYAAALDAFVAALRRAGPRTVAAAIVEPMSGSYCGVPLTRDLGRGIREACDQHGIKLVADEVITGFGRTGSWFGSSAVGLEPDAVVMAKGITGGYAPLGAVAFEASMARTLARTGFPHGLTYSGHPLGCAAARATLRILKTEDLVRASARKGALLAKSLGDVAMDHPKIVRDVRGRGLLVAFELRGERRWKKGAPHPASARTAKLRAALQKEGVLVYATPDGGNLLFSPPFTVGEDRIDRLVACIARLVPSVRNA